MFHTAMSEEMIAWLAEKGGAEVEEFTFLVTAFRDK